MNVNKQKVFIEIEIKRKKKKRRFSSCQTIGLQNFKLEFNVREKETSKIR